MIMSNAVRSDLAGPSDGRGGVEFRPTHIGLDASKADILIYTNRSIPQQKVSDQNYPHSSLAENMDLADLEAIFIDRYNDRYPPNVGGVYDQATVL